MDFITRAKIATCTGRGSIASDQPSSFDSAPGRTVVVRPNARKVARATTSGAVVADICMFARAANPLRTGPGAELITSTPRGANSLRSPSARLWIYALVAA